MIKLISVQEIIERTGRKASDVVYVINSFDNNPFEAKRLYETIDLKDCQIEKSFVTTYLAVGIFGKNADGYREHSLSDERFDEGDLFNPMFNPMFFNKEKDADFISKQMAKRTNKYQDDYNSAVEAFRNIIVTANYLDDCVAHGIKIRQLIKKAVKPVFDEYIRN